MKAGGVVAVASLGNAGFRITGRETGIIIDPFFDRMSRIPEDLLARTLGPGLKYEVIIITHDHWDHFDAGKTASLARSRSAVVAGPRTVTGRLEKLLPASSLVELEPQVPGAGQKCAGLSATVAGTRITAFRTFHSKAHNSYLVEMEGFRFFNDGDNEDTRPLDVEALGGLDAVMLCPWQGSGWVAFMEALRYKHWFLMHLDEDELDQQARGVFFEGLCDRVPGGLVCLRPGESRRIVG